MLGMEPRELMRKKEAEYKELGLADEGLSRQDLIAAMVQHPKLIERGRQPQDQVEEITTSREAATDNRRSITVT